MVNIRLTDAIVFFQSIVDRHNEQLTFWKDKKMFGYEFSFALSAAASVAVYLFIAAASMENL